MNDAASFFGIFQTGQMLFSLVDCQGRCGTRWAVAVIGPDHYAFWRAESVNGPRSYEMAGAGIVCPECLSGLRMVTAVAAQCADGRWLDMSDDRFTEMDNVRFGAN